ncbi:hypothetical protein H2200_008020 [Cladophialophora chaetospira]|uniref:Fe2OG dioxygenase domain-containing protein n=1 Tax=Cladophialophora chaetospira TaxID=386627 RepID=A0AA38X6Y9_9EURO|nr:hypothetical protein H2200_008020 [Cladophialophora chaetospira]
MASTIQHWTGFPPETYRQCLEEAFLRDCVTEAAIEHLFISLYKDDLFGLFVRAFKPGRIRTKTGEDGMVRYYWNYAMICPPPDVSFHPLEPYLADFARNIYSPQVPDEAQYVVKKYLDDVMEYAEKMFEGDMEEDESEEGYEDESEGDDENPNEDISHMDADVVDASTADNEADDQSEDTASEGTYGDISNWSFSTPDSRFQPIVNQAVTRRLKDIVAGAEAAAAFCCGGQISDLPPVVLRFDTSDGNVAKATFDGNMATPTTTSNSSSMSGVALLLGQCQPASFGVGDEEVHDKSYRDALKLDPTQFSTNLHPYDLGILHSIRKTLLPQVSTAAASTRCSRLRAELYKLNVYSGPSGKFKPHVDTPRSEDQFGSLVICLPVKHEGGNLVVRHQDRNVTFCWGSSDCVQWAAFFSDLEHEVEEVTSGHRVTLTYNLFWGAPSPDSGSLPAPATVKSLPLYGELEKVVSFGGFLPKGGMIGVYCTHSYIHNRKAKEVILPQSLKGVDMAFFKVCKALGLKAFVRPIRDPKETEWLDRTFYDDEDDYDDYLEEDEGYYDRRRFQLNKDGKPAPGDYILKYDYDCCDWKTKKKAKSFSERLARIKRERQVVGMEQLSKRKKVVTNIGKGFSAIDIDDDMICDDMDDEMSGGGIWERVTNVVWLNKPSHRELQRAYLAYGNEPGLGLSYTYAAILVRIPSYEKRTKKDSKSAGQA